LVNVAGNEALLAAACRPSFHTAASQELLECTLSKEARPGLFEK
jgi:hypothetical protein